MNISAVQPDLLTAACFTAPSLCAGGLPVFACFSAAAQQEPQAGPFKTLLPVEPGLFLVTLHLVCPGDLVWCQRAALLCRHA